MGDLKIVTLWENYLQQSYLDTITSNGFELLIKYTTRVSDKYETCIDQVKTRILDNLKINVLDDERFSDRCPAKF